MRSSIPRYVLKCGLVILATFLLLFSPGSGKIREKKQKQKAPAAEKRYVPVEGKSGSVVREPAVAGGFYPADPAALDRQIEGFLKNVCEDKDRKLLDERPSIILVPHAGYIYSGQTAAYAFAALEKWTYDTVFLIGQPHRVTVYGASVYCGSGWRTPCGVVPVDTGLVKALVESSGLINDNAQPHRREHSLEVELPFLQKVLGDFSIVPMLVMGEPTVLDVITRSIIDTVSKHCGPDRSILYVISTDLSHYPKKTDAYTSDTAILRAFCSLDGMTLLKENIDILESGIPNLACTMCGLDAAYVGIRIANTIGADNAVVLHRGVSSDAGCEGATDDHVVGYAAVAVTGRINPPYDSGKMLSSR